MHASQQSPRILVAYFSMQDGNTGDVARAIVDATGGDIYRIMVAQPYPDDDKMRKELLTQQVEQNILPPLASPVGVAAASVVLLNGLIRN